MSKSEFSASALFGLVADHDLIGRIRLLRDFAVTRLLYPRARLIRFPFYIRGAARISIGPRLTTGVGVRLQAVGREPHVVLRVGSRVQMNDYVHIAAAMEVSIGNDVLIASRVFISDHNHGGYGRGDVTGAPEICPIDRELSCAAVRIEEKAWIGEQVCILPGVTVGRGSIVGAGAVVTKNVAPGVIVAGNPARVVKSYDASRQRWVRV